MIFISRCFCILLFWMFISAPSVCLSDDFLSDDELDFELELETSDENNENNEEISDINTEEGEVTENVETSVENTASANVDSSIKEDINVRQPKVFPMVKTNDLFHKVKYSQVYGVNDIKRWLDGGADINECLESGKTLLVEMVRKSIDVEAVSYLIDNGADMITRCNPRYNVLFEAAENNTSSAIIDLLIIKGGDILYKDYEKNSVVNIASLNPKPRVIQTILEYGIDINNKNIYGLTPLMLAAYKNNILVVDVLLRNGAKVNEVDNEGRTALMAAALSGNNEVMDLLIKNGAKVKLLDNHNMSVLDYFNKKEYLNDEEYKKNWHNEYASISEILAHKYEYVSKQHKFYNDMLYSGILDVSENSYPTAKKALDRLADIDFKYVNNNTPLCEAGYRGNFNVLKLLVNKKANVNAECNPILQVTKGVCDDIHGNVEEYLNKLNILVKNGANINTLDEEGNNALLFALKNDAPKDYILKLLELGSNVSLSDKNGVTPLSVAFAKRNYPIEIYEEIIKRGGDVNVNSLDGNKLIWAEIMNNSKAGLLEVLLKNGAEAEKDGDYPICYFLREKFNTINDYDARMEILDVLVKYEKKLNEAICDTYTPLTFVVKNNFPADVIRLLLSYGADPEVKDKGGISMVDYLSSREHYDDTIIIKTRENVTEGW